MERLVAPDLVPRRVARHVVGERDEVESRPALGERLEGVVEGVGHGGRAVVRVLGVHVHVAGVPARLVPGGGLVVGGRLVRLVVERGILGELDLHAPLDLAVGVALALRDHRAHAQLGRPLAGLDPARDEAARGLAGHLHARAGGVLGLGGEALRRQRHVGMARPAPAAELGLAPQLRGALPRPVQAEVERVAHRAALGPVPAVLDANGGGPARHVEGQQDVVLVDVRAELAGDDPVRRDRASAAGGGQPRPGLARDRRRRCLRRRGRGEQQHGESREGGGRSAGHGRESMFRASATSPNPPSGAMRRPDSPRGPGGEPALGSKQTGLQRLPLRSVARCGRLRRRKTAGSGSERPREAGTRSRELESLGPGSVPDGGHLRTGATWTASRCLRGSRDQVGALASVDEEFERMHSSGDASSSRTWASCRRCSATGSAARSGSTRRRSPRSA